jgi:predicted dehydrogenase
MIRLAIVGCGGMANGYHVQQLQKISDYKVVALCDIVKEKTADFKNRYFNDAVEFDDFYKMLKDGPELDAVLLVTPHTVHYPHAKAALEKGINVMCEKPLVTSSKHAYDLWKTVKQTGKLLAITFQSAYSAEFGHLAQLRDEGKLGQVQNISGYVSQGWCKGTKGKWRQEPELSGGGYIYDTGAHLLNALMWLMNSPVVEVSCMMDNCGTPVDIRGSASLKFQNGVFGTITMAGNTPVFRTDIQIFTDSMVVITDQYGGKLEMYDAAGKRMYPHVPADSRPAAGTPHLNFADALLRGAPLRAPVRYGVLLSALMDALYESAKAGLPVKVKPVPEDIEVNAKPAKKARSAVKAKLARK